MSLPYRSTPLEKLDQLKEIYGSNGSLDQIPYVAELSAAKNDLIEIIRTDEYTKYGVVISIEGTWGSGKSSFVELLKSDLASERAAIVQYDSLFYGNASEATAIFIKDIFNEVKNEFGIKLRNTASIAKNISPRFELSAGIPKLLLSYDTTRASTEEIRKRELGKLLGRLPGKVIVIIDDIDRNNASDAVHFLRLVRVLREMPNFIIIIPIDRAMLENLIKTQGVENPKRYLEKIIDKAIDINPDQGSSKDLFFRLLRRKFPENDLSDELVNYAWDFYIWEISCLVIRQFETNDQQRFVLNVGSNDALWSILEPTASLNGELLVRKFFEQTSAAYGATSNFVFRIRNNANAQEDIYQHYSQVLANTTFTDFIHGRFFPNLSPELTLETINNDVTATMRWWDDKESIVDLQNAPDKSQKTDYRVTVPADETDKNKHYEELNQKAHYVWDTIRALAGAYLPERAIQYLAPRTLNRVIEGLNLDIKNVINAKSTEDYAELQRDIKRAVEKIIIYGE